MSELLWVGHRPQSAYKHLVVSSRTNPVNRSLPAGCGVYVRVTHRPEWEELLVSGTTCSECLVVMNSRLREELASARVSMRLAPEQGG